jgi:hypothetical protein
MKEIQELPAVTANRRRIVVLEGLVLCLFAWLAASGCSIKQKTKIEVPIKIAQAKTATYEELLQIINNYNKIYEMSSNGLRLTLTMGKLESGVLDKYRRAPGYILLRRPDSIRLVIQEPIIKTAQVDMLSVKDNFYLWIRSRNEFYTGTNSAKELIAEDLPDSPEIPIRPRDIFEAVLPQGIVVDSTDIRIAREEDMDAESKYYVLSVYKEEMAPVSHTVRRIWIERSSLTVARQRLFGEEGQIVADIAYSDMDLTDGFSLPLEIHMDRPQDGYALDMEFTKGSWRINSALPDNAFILTPPEGAKIIPLKEKGRSDIS